MTTAEQILDRLERSAEEQHAATKAALQLCRTMMVDASARTADDDDWLRMPATGGTCPISGWSRTTLARHIRTGDVRKRSLRRMTYYSGADVRTALAAHFAKK